MNYLDLFSGIGGFHLGLLQAGFKFDWCGHSEIDKYAETVYHKHFSESECLGNVKEIDPSTLPKIDLLTFGFPCQDISIAGKRTGLQSPRSGLFFEAMRIISECRPDIFIFENVKGLFSSNNGRDFENILREIADLGIYDCEWQLLNTRWVLPQNRERIYFIGHLRGRSSPKVFPFREGDKDVVKSRSEHKSGLWVQSVDSNYYKGADGKRTMIQIYDGLNDYIKDDLIIPTLSSINCSSLTNRTGFGIMAEAQRVYSPEGCARTIKDGGGQGAKTGLYKMGHGNIRRLTPVECARLQGFPDDWCKDLSDTQAYKCYGNAVTVPIVTLLAKRLLNDNI